MLTLHRLRILHELSRRGTLAEVAAALHLSPSAVSQQLATLEREAGVALLRRSGRGVLLTPQGEVLAERAGAILEMEAQARAELAEPGTEAVGTLRLAAFQSVVLTLVPPLLAHLRAEHPRLQVTLTQHEPEAALERTWLRDFDLVIAEEYPDHAAPHHPGLDRVELMRDPITLAVASGAPDVTDLASTAGARWVMEPEGAASRHWAMQQCRRAGFEPDVRYETADLQAHLALVASGEAVAFIPGLMRASSPAAVHHLALPDAPHRTIFSAAAEGSPSRAGIEACREALRVTAASVLA